MMPVNTLGKRRRCRDCARRVMISGNPIWSQGHRRTPEDSSRSKGWTPPAPVSPDLQADQGRLKASLWEGHRQVFKWGNPEVIGVYCTILSSSVWDVTCFSLRSKGKLWKTSFSWFLLYCHLWKWDVFKKPSIYMKTKQINWLYYVVKLKSF